MHLDYITYSYTMFVLLDLIDTLAVRSEDLLGFFAFSWHVYLPTLRLGVTLNVVVSRCDDIPHSIHVHYKCADSGRTSMSHVYVVPYIHQPCALKT